MPNYQNAKIYKIYSYENDDVYYGSTVETLSQRMAHHKTHLKLYKEGKYGYLTSFKILELTSAKIELVENYPCNSREELLQREGYYIRNNNCVNKIIAGRTRKEWRNDNKEQIKEYTKEYNKQYFNQLKEQSNEYCKQNKDKLKEYAKIYYETNRNKINEKQREKYNANRNKMNEKQKEYRKQKKEQALMLKEDINII
jgi:hypothetical protein